MAHIMTNKKRHVKWEHVDPEVAKTVRKIIPPVYFKGVKHVVATKSPVYSMLVDRNDKNFADYINDEHSIVLFLDRFEAEMKGYYRDKKIRKYAEILVLAHEFCHNWQRINGKLHQGVSVMNPIYRKKIEKQANRMAQMFVNRHFPERLAYIVEKS